MVRLPPDPRAAQGLNKTGCQGRLVESIAGRYSAFRAAAACIRPCGTSRSCSAAVSVAMRGTLPFSCREKARRHGTGTQPQALQAFALFLCAVHLFLGAVLAQAAVQSLLNRYPRAIAPRRPDDVIEPFSALTFYSC